MQNARLSQIRSTVSPTSLPGQPGIRTVLRRDASTYFAERIQTMRLVNVTRICFLLALLALGAVCAQGAPRTGDPFQLPESYRWVSGTVIQVSSANRAKAETLKDASIMISGNKPEVDTYTIVLDTDSEDVS